MTETKFIITNKLGTTKLNKNEDGFWQDDKGTLYAYKDANSTTDNVDRCGVWPVALPIWSMFQTVNADCGVHDIMYSSPIYQAFHTRAEADAQLDQLLDLSNHPLIADIFSEIARLLGSPFWEVNATND